MFKGSNNEISNIKVKISNIVSENNYKISYDILSLRNKQRRSKILKKKNNKGFTLLHPLVAMAILGIILLSFFLVAFYN